MSDISDAVQSAYGGLPLVQCGRERASRTADGVERSGREVLSSLAVCITRDLTIMDCPQTIISREGCRSSELYYLPF